MTDTSGDLSSPGASSTAELLSPTLTISDTRRRGNRPSPEMTGPPHIRAAMVEVLTETTSISTVETTITTINSPNDSNSNSMNKNEKNTIHKNVDGTQSIHLVDHVPADRPPTRTARTRCLLFGRHYAVLMWKNMILRRRRPGFLIAELLAPILLTCLMIILCRRGTENQYPTCYSQSIAMPSMGVLSFVQSMLCNFAYSCSATEPPPLTFFPNETGWPDLVNSAQDLAADPWIVKIASGTPAGLPDKKTIHRIYKLYQAFDHLVQKYGAILSAVDDPSQSDEEISFLNWTISVSSLNKLENISVLLCGVPPDQNDLGRLVAFLKSINGVKKDRRGNGRLNRVARSLAQNNVNSDTASNQTTKPIKTICERIIDIFNTRPISPYTDRLQFFLFSYIYYYPSNIVTDTIMKRATASHRLLLELKHTIKQLIDRTLPGLRKILTESQLMIDLRRGLDECIAAGTAESQYCLGLRNFLNPKLYPGATGSNIFTILDGTEELGSMLEDLLNCMNLDYRLLPSTRKQFEEYMKIFAVPTLPSAIGVEFQRVPTTLDWASIRNRSEHVFEVALRRIGETFNFKVFDRYWSPRPRQNPLDGDMRYITSGFIDVQEAVSQAILSIAWSQPDPLSVPPNVTQLFSNRITANELKLFPTACYTDRSFLASMTKMLPQFMLFAWVFTAMFTAKCIVDEKEQRLKEFTKIMGVSNITHWLGWLTMNLLIMVPCTVLITILLKYTQVLRDTDYGVLLLLFLSFALSVIALTFLCSTFFTHANLAAVVTGMLYFILYLPVPMILANDVNLPQSAFYGASVSSQVAFSLGFYYILRAESYGSGTTWSTFWSSKYASISEFSVGKAVLMLWVDISIYLLLTWYIEAIYPGRYGIRQPFYFPFTRSYWCGSKRPQQESLHAADQPSTALARDPLLFEPPPDHASVGILVRDLSKRYKKRARPALDGLSVNFYANQVTSLLGHNGAGKSTLMAILTGMQPATSGLAMVAGYEISKHLETVRDMLGFCPQYNILFDHLTVAEHIHFYAALKGVPGKTIDTQVDQLMELLGFPDKRNDRSKTLSGGQKRKLSVAIAFVGRSKVVFLDEPTAGVDPYSRRSIWDLITSLKQGRTIVLTTHHMDEADILGDRIALISQGRLKCEGSSLFLKTNHGQGYHLILQRNTKADDEFAEVSETINNQDVLNYVRRFMPEATLVHVGATEITLQLPGHYATDGTFTQFFKHMESNPPHLVPDALLKLGIIGYGLSDTSLEEVFLEMADDPSNQSEIPEEVESAEADNSLVESGQPTEAEHENQTEGDAVRGAGSEVQIRHRRLGEHFSRRRSQMAILRHSSRLQRFTDGGQLPTPATRQSLIDRRSLFSKRALDVEHPDDQAKSRAWIEAPTSEKLKVSVTQQLRAMFPKRFHHFKRYKRGWIVEFILPVLLTLLAMGFVSIRVYVTVTNPPMPLNPWWQAPKSGVLSTFYENHAYADGDPQEWPSESELVYQVAVEYQKALDTPYGWTGTRCLPKDVYEFVPASESSCEYTWNNLPLWEPRSELTAFERDEARNSSQITCSCKTGRMECPADCVKPNPPPHVTLQTTDVLYNLTAYNVNDYLLKTSNQFFLKRFGGLSFMLDPSWPLRGPLENLLSPQNPLYEALGWLTPVQNSSSKSLMPDPVWAALANSIRLMLPPPYHTQIWFNNKGYVSAVAYLNMLQNMQLRMVQGAKAIPSRRTYGLVIVDHPLPLAEDARGSENSGSLIYDVTLALFTLLALSFIPASFITFLVLEVQTGSKHLQFVSGLNGYVYWLSVYLWDIVNYLVPAVLCIIIFVSFRKMAYIGADSFGAFFGLMLLYGLAVLPMLYPASFFIRNPSTALVVVAIVNLILGATTVMSTFLLDYLEKDSEGLASANTALQTLFLIFPQYAFGRGLYNLALREYMLKYRSSGFVDVDQWENPVAWNVVGRNLLALGIESIVYAGLVVLIEHEFYRTAIRDYFHWRYPSLGKRYSHRLRKRLAALDREDGAVIADDVLEEQERVQRLEESGQLHANNAVSTLRLVKFFRRKKKPTVNRLTFAVRQAECFGLLGVNGAGKTTTFRILSGGLFPTIGDAYVNGFHVVDQKIQAHRSLGYCPQFDAILDLLTGRETLTLYARLRGVPEKDIPHVVSQLLADMSLAPHADKIAGAYSGGNRRKLSTAIALLGGPKVIFLDEPTSGMDPVGKRFLWDQINNLLRCGKSIVLTSHSMEECEALCNRLGIMVNGQFRCFGTVQQLKERFGNGYTAELRMSNQLNVGDHIRAIIQAEFAHVEVSSTQTRSHEYQFEPGISLSRLFSLLNRFREHRMIQQYSVRQTTLDQVFVNFTRMQMEQGETSQDTEDLSDTEMCSTDLPQTE